MLRITVKEVNAEQQWILQGHLTRNSVPELVSNWQSFQNHPLGCNRVVDLDEVTVIDKSGEEVLAMMIDEGVAFVANGLYTKHLLETLRTRRATPPASE